MLWVVHLWQAECGYSLLNAITRKKIMREKLSISDKKRLLYDMRCSKDLSLRIKRD